MNDVWILNLDIAYISKYTSIDSGVEVVAGERVILPFIQSRDYTIIRLSES